MAGPTIEQFRQLEQQVERLSSLITAQAVYQQQLASFAQPIAPPDDPDQLFDKKAACDEIVCSRSSFDRARKALSIKPAAMYGRSPRFNRDQVNLIRDYLAKDD